MDRIKPNLPVTTAQDLRQWGSKKTVQSQPSGITVMTEAARVALEEPRNVQVTISYSESYSAASNDTRVEITYGTGTASSAVQVREGTHVFPAQNLRAVVRRFDAFNMIVAHPPCTVDVYCTLTDEPPSWVAYDEVP